MGAAYGCLTADRMITRGSPLASAEFMITVKTESGGLSWASTILLPTRQVESCQRVGSGSRQGVIDKPIRIPYAFSGAGVPPFESRLPSVFTQYRHGARVERKVHARAQVEPEPAHRQRPERMTVTETDRLINA
jgi:hypothetical protein